MRQQFLKRLLFLLPAVWLIASAVFLLGKLMPGSAAEIAHQQAIENSGSNIKAEMRQKAFVQLRHRTGQDLPLFYFGLGTAAEPDTLFRIYPEADQVALQKLLFQYGSWPVVAKYYLDLKNLNAMLTGKPELKQQVKNLLLKVPEERVKTIFSNLKAAGAADKKLQNAILQAEKSHQLLQRSSPDIKNYLPVLHWYGLGNQYHLWFGQLLQGNMGVSGRDGRPVEDLVLETFSFTLKIALATFVITAFLAIEIAIFLSRKSKRLVKKLGLVFLFTLESLPLYVLALFMLPFFYSVIDEGSPLALILPVVCLVLANLPYLTMQAYTSLQQVLELPFIATARAKGLSEMQVLRQQALRPALLPVITLLADFFPALLAGTVVLEVVFSLPGMGSLLVESVLARDYQVLAGIILVIGFARILAQLIADVLLVVTDPRLRAKTL